MKKQTLKNLLLITFLLVCTLSFYYFITNIKVYSVFFSKKEDPILTLPIYIDHREEYKHFNINEKRQGLIIFAGDSIMRRFNIHEYFPDLPVLNRGIFYDTTNGLLMRIEDNINNLDINKLFVMIGYNDLRYRTNEKIINNLKRILASIKADNIYIFSLLPVKHERGNLNKRILDTNNQIKQLCLDMNFHFINILPAFSNEQGGLAEKYSRDGVHPNEAGYQMMAEQIKQFLFPLGESL